MRGTRTWQWTGVQSYTRPGDALHKWHLRILIEVRDVVSVLLQHSEDTGRGFIHSAAG